MRLIPVAVGLISVATTSIGQQRAEFRSALDIVEVHVTVRGRDGAAVRDLERGDFDLRVDGRPRDIQVFSRETQPISIAMILDASGSIRQDDRRRINQAAQIFVGYLRDDDRMAVRTLHWDCQALTGDRVALAAALGALPFPGDLGSPIWNAVGQAVDRLASEPRRRAILLFSDGQDTGNPPEVNAPGFTPRIPSFVKHRCTWSPSPRNLSIGDVRQAAERESVMVYAVSADSPGPDQSVGLRRLADITFDSGGALHRLGTLAEVRGAFVRIAEELHLQYALGFAQTEFDGERHDIRVRVNRRDVSVRARHSFIAAKRPPY